MSRLAELIEELCPDGVEYRPLGELLSYQQPTPFLVSSKDYDPSYPTPVLTAGATFLLGYSSETHGVYAASTDDPVIIFDDFTTASKWVDFPFKLKSSAAKILTAADPCVADIRFLYFLMQTIKYQVGSHARQWIAVYSKIPVCCPPLEVQREIVRILDQFTTLEAELEAELEARRVQYEHYRNHLLSYESLATRSPVKVVKLGDVIAISRGASPRPISKYVTQGEGIPWIKIGDVDPRGKFVTSAAECITSAGAEKSRKVLPGDFILSNSMSFGRPYILQIEGCVHDGWLILSNVADHWIPDFLYHSLRTDNVQRQFAQLASGGTVRNLNSRVIESVELPLPPKVAQEEIVSMLDRFDALVNDISSGLPAEIAARRAQYEHYRDRLLSFREKAVSGSDAS